MQSTPGSARARELEPRRGRADSQGQLDEGHDAHQRLGLEKHSGNTRLAKPRAEKKSEPAVSKVLPLDLRVGDRLTDETGEWEIIGRPYTVNHGKSAHARVRRVDQHDITAIRTWVTHERISAKRASPEEGK